MKKKLAEIETYLSNALSLPWMASGRDLVTVSRELPESDQIVARSWTRQADQDIAILAPMDLARLVALVRKYSAWGRRVVAHCEAMNFNTREEDWIKQELDEVEEGL